MTDTITYEQPQIAPVEPQEVSTHDGRPMGPSMSDELAQTVAFVLGRARRRADAEATPEDSRAILHVASSFADDLAKDGFDGTRFFQAFEDAQR